MKRTKEEAEKTKQDILEAALQVFSQQGYQAARLQDIAKAAGVTRGAVYHHFEGKADLYRTLLDEASAEGSGVLDAAIAEGGNLREIMARVLTYSLAYMEENRRLRQVFELSLNKIGNDPELEEIRSQRVEQSDQLIQATASIMAQGILRGELRDDLDPTMVARAFIAYQTGVAMLWLNNRQAFSLEETAADFTDIFIGGLLPYRDK